MYKHFASLTIAIIIVVFSSGTQSATLTLAPSSQAIDLNDMLSIDLLISDLGDLSSPSLGAFDVDITFDNSILSFNSETFGTMLGLSIQNVNTSASGVIGLSEVSLELTATLDSIQPDSFLLATLMFQGIGEGTTPLGFSSIALSDAIGSVIPNPAFISSSATVVVPLPASVWLFLSAFGGLLFMRKK